MTLINATFDIIVTALLNPVISIAAGIITLAAVTRTLSNPPTGNRVTGPRSTGLFSVSLIGAALIFAPFIRFTVALTEPYGFTVVYLATVPTFPVIIVGVLFAIDQYAARKRYQYRTA